MDFLKLINLKLRKFILSICNFIAPLVAKTGIGKLRLRGRPLGNRIYSLIFRVLQFGLPEPIKVRGMIMYHRSPDNRNWLAWLYPFNYEPGTYRMFNAIAKPGMAMVDVGAHIGYYSLLAAKLAGNKGKVYAFEPDPAYYILLKKNIAANRFQQIIEPFRFAVGNKEKEATLFLGKSTETSLFKIADTINTTAVVEMISLDKFFASRNWPLIDIVKVDTEGAEKLVSEGMRELVGRNPRLKLIIELAPRFLKAAGTTAEELLLLLGQLGLNQVSTLLEEEGHCEIPQDIQYLANLGQKSGFINLLCERYL